MSHDSCVNMFSLIFNNILAICYKYVNINIPENLQPMHLHISDSLQKFSY
jgi:hypothetical protein